MCASNAHQIDLLYFLIKVATAKRNIMIMNESLKYQKKKTWHQRLFSASTSKAKNWKRSSLPVHKIRLKSSESTVETIHHHIPCVKHFPCLKHYDDLNKK